MKRSFINFILNFLEKKKVTNIVHINNKYLYSEDIIIATGISENHLNSIAKNIKVLVNNDIKISGYNSNWIVIDMKFITIHVMLQCARNRYNLEKLYNYYD